MKKVALVFVIAVLVPSLVLAWLAVRSLRDQQFLLERQQSLLDQRVTDALAQTISDYLAQRQQEFSAQVESLAGNEEPRAVAAKFDTTLRQRWPLAEVGFCVTLSGKILSPPPNARPEAQMFRLDNSDFLGNLEAVEVYWNANNFNNANVNNANGVNNASSFARNSLSQSSLAVNGSMPNRQPPVPSQSVAGSLAEQRPLQPAVAQAASDGRAQAKTTEADSARNGQNQMLALNNPSSSRIVGAGGGGGGFGGGRQVAQKELKQTPAPAGNAAQVPQTRQQFAYAATPTSGAAVATVSPPTETSALDSLKDTASQQPAQNIVNYKAAQARKVSPQSQQYQFADKADVVADGSDNNLSRVIPAEAEFRQLVGNETDGMLARFLQNKLKLMFWHRLNAAPDLIFGAQLNLARVVDGLRGLIQPDPDLQNEICLVLLDDNAKPVAISNPNFQANWKRPFVATEIGDALPHWEVAAYLIDPAALTRAACIANIALGLLIVVLVLAIVIGSWLIVRNLNHELTLARQKTDFVSNVSHELKTPLTSIRMFSELLAEGRVADPTRQRSYLNIITAEAARLTRLINNVLDFSRMESGEKKYNFQPCDVVEIARATAETFRPHLEANGFRLDCELASTPISIRGDADALSQILVNLLSNAEKYSAGSTGIPAGEPGDGKEITVQVALKQSPLPHAEIKVLDRGSGVPRGSEEKVFEKFYRAHDSLSSGIQGSGLGLTIARQIARAHGGDVVYESREGGGSCFVLRLPIAGGSRREEAQI